MYPNIYPLWFNRVLNADMPVIYIGVSVHMHMKCVIEHSVTRAV